MAPARLTAAAFAELGLDGWRWLGHQIRTQLRAGSFTEAGRLAAAIAKAADEADHHPAVELRYPDRVLVRLWTHTAGGVTELDVDLARRIDALAAAAGAAHDPGPLRVTELAIDAMDIEAVRPFWAAVLGYRDVPSAVSGEVDDLADPLEQGPDVWFQQMDEPRPQRNRIHVDVWVPHDRVDAVREAALAAGGTLVSDAAAPAFWVLADPEGNEACLCTWQARP